MVHSITSTDNMSVYLPPVLWALWEVSPLSLLMKMFNKLTALVVLGNESGALCIESGANGMNFMTGIAW